MAKVSFKKCIRQVVFHVSFFSFWGIKFIWAYDSVNLQRSSEIKPKTYYFQDLDNLRKAVQPRVIRYIDSANLATHGKIFITGVLFTFQDQFATNVSWVSSHNRFRGIRMRKNKHNVWYYVYKPKNYLLEKSDKFIRYKYLVNMIYTHDPQNPLQIEDNSRGILSLFHLDSIAPVTGVQVLPSNTIENKEVLFRFYAPQALEVYLVGSFNHWNDSMDPLKKDRDGYFSIRKRLRPGIYFYFYQVDGEKVLDPSFQNLNQHLVFGKVAKFIVK